MDLSSAGVRWPRFAPEAVEVGFDTVYALPLRLRSMTIGALNLFRVESTAMPAEDVRLAQALADVASIAILQDQAVRASQIESGQLQHALHSRVAGRDHRSRGSQSPAEEPAGAARYEVASQLGSTRQTRS